MSQFITLGPFLGLVTSISAQDLTETYCQDLKNVRIEDGKLMPRYGFNVLSSSASGTNVYHFGFYTTSLTDPVSALIRNVSGSAEFGASRSRQEFYISVEKRNGVAKPYFIDPQTVQRYEITARGSSLSLSPSGGYWRGFGFDDSVYLFNQYDPSYPLVSLTLGATGSWSAVQVPQTPGSSLSQRISVVYSKGASGFESTRYRTINFSGLDTSSEITYGGTATSTNSGTTTNTLSIAHTVSASGDASFELDLSAMTAGIQDLTSNDCLYFTLNSRTPGTFEINPYSVKVTVTNNDITPVATDLATVAGSTTYGIGVYASFNDKDRTLWDNVKKLKVSYQVSKSSTTATDNRIDMSVITVGGVTNWPSSVFLGYTWLNSTYGYESGVGGVGTLDQTLLKGSSISLGDRGTYYLGTIPRVTVTNGASLSPLPDYTQLYLRDGNVWRRISTQSTASLTYYLNTTAQEVQGLDEYTPSTFAHRNLTCSAVYRNAWVIWGYDDGSNNVRHSRIGEPIKLASDSDLDTDTNRGADFVLGDTTGDIPRAITTVDNVIFIFGDEGVYAQIAGDSPSSCTPPKRIAGAPPLFGPDSYVKWKDDQGRPGIAYMARGGQAIYFLTVSNALDFDVGQRPIEISSAIRGNVITSFLFGDSQTPNPETLAMFVDERVDALWVYYNNRALVYRRPSQIDNRRQWEKYDYQSGTYSTQRHKFAIHSYWGLRAMRLDGTIDEFEYNSSSGFTPITGANRDGGQVMTPIYWVSKTFYTWPMRTRLFGIQINRSLNDAPSFTATSTENTATYSSTANIWNTRFSPLQKGYEHSLKITLSETSDPVIKVVIELHQIGKRRGS